MKKISLILISIVFGIAIGFSLAKFTSTLHKQDIEQVDTQPKINDIFDFGEIADRVYLLSSKNELLPTVTVNLSQSNLISEIRIIDTHLNTIHLVDPNLDGRWDYWFYRNKFDHYAYSQMSGYPKSVTIGGYEPLVRVGEDYVQAKSIGEKKFIDVDNEQVELEEINTKYYRIKK